MAETPPENEHPSGAPLSLEARVERLERMVERLLLERGGPVPESPAPPEPTPGTMGAPGDHPSQPWSTYPPRGAPKPRRRGLDWVRLGEDWLGRVGVLLLLLGLAFLYRYAVDRGWITPWLRVGFGALVGVALLALGLYRTRSRPLYSQVLLGGSVAVLYLTGWAAQALYGLVPWTVGMSWMATVTVLALALAERREHQVLAVIGAAGGLATPFLLESPGVGAAGLVAYSVLVLGWGGLLQLRRGWGVLLSVNLVGGMAVMAAAAAAANGAVVWSVQFGIGVAWGVACVFPYLQGWLHLRHPSVWPAPPAPWSRRTGRDPSPPVSGGLLWLLGIGVSGVAVLLTAAAWGMGRVGVGVTFVGVAALHAVGWRLLRSHRDVARPALESGAVLLVLGTALAAGRPWLPLPLALEAAVFLWTASRTGGATSLEPLGHLVFVMLAYDYLAHLAGAGGGGSGPYAAGVLAAMAVAAACGALLVGTGVGRRAYSLGSLVGLLSWLAWQLTPLPGGQGLVTAAWALCAVVLLAVGMRARSVALRIAGLATLAAVTAKLLLVDLSALDRGLRILLFLGFGGLFLLLGFVFRGRDAAPGAAPEARDPAEEDGHEAV